MADSQSRLKPDGLLVFGYQRPHAHCDEKVKQVENERDAIVADQSSQGDLCKTNPIAAMRYQDWCFTERRTLDC